MKNLGRDALPTVLDRRELLDCIECMRMGKWLEPPLPCEGLARSFRAAAHHSSARAMCCPVLRRGLLLLGMPGNPKRTPRVGVL